MARIIQHYRQLLVLGCAFFGASLLSAQTTTDPCPCEGDEPASAGMECCGEEEYDPSTQCCNDNDEIIDMNQPAATPVDISASNNPYIEILPTRAVTDTRVQIVAVFGQLYLYEYRWYDYAANEDNRRIDTRSTKLDNEFNVSTCGGNLPQRTWSFTSWNYSFTISHPKSPLSFTATYDPTDSSSVSAEDASGDYKKVSRDIFEIERRSLDSLMKSQVVTYTVGTGNDPLLPSRNNAIEGPTEHPGSDTSVAINSSWELSHYESRTAEANCCP